MSCQSLLASLTFPSRDSQWPDGTSVHLLIFQFLEGKKIPYLCSQSGLCPRDILRASSGATSTERWQVFIRSRPSCRLTGLQWFVGLKMGAWLFCQEMENNDFMYMAPLKTRVYKVLWQKEQKQDTLGGRILIEKPDSKAKQSRTRLKVQ